MTKLGVRDGLVTPSTRNVCMCTYRSKEVKYATARARAAAAWGQRASDLRLFSESVSVSVGEAGSRRSTDGVSGDLMTRGSRVGGTRKEERILQGESSRVLG